VLAKAEPAAASPEPATESRPFYQRVLGNVLGSGETAKPAAAAQIAAETAPGSAAASPVPPRRASVAVTPPKSPAAAPIPPKPQAATPRPQKHVDAGSAIFGSQPVGPLSGGFARN
jgi:hypothetical protein